MSPAQTQFYFRTWQAAAAAHGWNFKAGVVAALAAHHAGEVWQSPALNRTLAPIYEHAEFSAQRDGREVTGNDLRHACTALAVGRQASSKSFSNQDFDCVLALLRVLAEPQNLKYLAAFEHADESGERRRHVHVITQADEFYWRKISRDRFGHFDLDRLTLVQLRQLSLTIRNRLRARTEPSLQAA